MTPSIATSTLPVSPVEARDVRVAARARGLEMSMFLICLRIARDEPAPGRPPTRAAVDDDLADLTRIRLLLAELGEVRLDGDSPAARAVAAEARELLAQIPEDHHDEARALGAILDGHLASLEMNRGNLHEAAARLNREVELASGSAELRAARADCAGQLALLEAFRGDLRRAMQHVACVLELVAEGATSGLAQAYLARAWVHLERGETAPARQIIDRLPRAVRGRRDPWFATAQLLAEARLNTAEGRPDAALRLLAPAARATSDRGDRRWLAGLLAIASAEAFIAAGEPHQALALVTPLPPGAGADPGVLAASARRDIGDSRGARAALATVAADLNVAPLGVQLQAWVLEARLADADDHHDRAHLLVDRALRAASAEGLRRPLAKERAWLRTFIERDPSLKRDHRVFLESLVPARGDESTLRREQPGSGGSLFEPLTGRELEVLELLAQMYATDEIAGELHLSVNTVKTHIKGLFRKLGVNRRTAAVRRGRELCLC